MSLAPWKLRFTWLDPAQSSAPKIWRLPHNSCHFSETVLEGPLVLHRKLVLFSSIHPSGHAVDHFPQKSIHAKYFISFSRIYLMYKRLLDGSHHSLRAPFLCPVSRFLPSLSGAYAMPRPSPSNFIQAEGWRSVSTKLLHTAHRGP